MSCSSTSAFLFGKVGVNRRDGALRIGTTDKMKEEMLLIQVYMICIRC